MILKLIILAIIQGLTEPLPISSSGHLVIMEELMGLELPGFSFELFLNFGSLIGVVVFFWSDLLNYASSLKEKSTWTDIGKIAIAIIPVGIVGLFFSDMFEVFKNTTTVAIFLLFTALILFIPKYMNGDRKMSWLDSIMISIAHIIALIPGVSRSGVTTVTAISRGVKKEEAFRFSFMIYIPLSLLSGVYSLFSLESFTAIYMVYLFISAIMTYAGLVLFKRLLLQERLHYFSYYCVFLALLILVGMW